MKDTDILEMLEWRKRRPSHALGCTRAEDLAITSERYDLWETTFDHMVVVEYPSSADREPGPRGSLWDLI